MTADPPPQPTTSPSRSPRRTAIAIFGACWALVAVHWALGAPLESLDRRLVTAVHPDKGGSEELTRRINAARDTLLRRSA